MIDILPRSIRATASDLLRVVTMFLPVTRAPQQSPPQFPWSETSQVDLGPRGRLSIRHTPGIEVDERDPVVFLHGITLTGDANFAALADVVERCCPAIVFDAPNHGSGIAVEEFDFEDFADDIVAVLDQLGIGRAVLCGYSLGGITAMILADRHPTRVAGIVVQAAAMRYGISVRERLFLHAMGIMHRLHLENLGRSLPVRYWRIGTRISPAAAERWSWWEKELSTGLEPRLSSLWKAVGNIDLRRSSISVPSVVVLAAQDRICPPVLQREAAGLLDAHVIEVDADHDMPFVAPETYARATEEALLWMYDRLRSVPHS
ncbi:MAG: alpha/beta fold hydrolase [Rhodococcus sp. (in: high G+C Gram-positive bacteria)]